MPHELCAASATNFEKGRFEMNADTFKDLRTARRNLEMLIQELGLDNNLAKRLDDGVMEYLNRIHRMNGNAEQELKEKEKSVAGITSTDEKYCGECGKSFKEFEIVYYNEQTEEIYCDECKIKLENEIFEWHERFYLND